MKTIAYVLAGMIMLSFSTQQTEAIDGIWTGIYRADNLREKVWVKFAPQNTVELYNGEVIETNKVSGTYQLQGDSVLKVTYQTEDGKQYTMQGHINRKKNYVDGTWQASDKLSGSFYLKKEKIQEMFIQP
ncbi:MAG TPA: hypothetical protein VFS22_05560 [Flavisolibacter sp.]|nr:hypothetical protein [Flavisolibacter sp.]